ncbi:uncharacterized protein [Linepithema humile]|uniref:uncharacterized protein n=1 Tax=Linepithema humile TaxID=83485 RepID=UPI00351E0FE6
MNDDALPSTEPEPHSSGTIVKITENEDQLTSEESDNEPSQPPPWSGPLPWPVTRPIIKKGRRRHMLSEEEMKEIQPIKYVRSIRSVNWDEISKVPAEAKIAWEVAMEELKENNDEIKHLHAQVHQLNATILKLKKVLKARKMITADVSN